MTINRIFQKRVWTPEDDAALRRLWDEGLPSRAIARVFQVSKNSVIGRAHRLKVTPRPSPLPRAPRKPEARRLPRGPAPIEIEIAPIEIELVPLPVATPEDRAPGSGNGYRRPLKVLTPPLPPAPPPAPLRRCQFPIGDPKDRPRFHYCDAPVTAHDRVYCAEHHEICYLGRARTVYADARDRMIR